MPCPLSLTLKRDKPPFSRSISIFVDFASNEFSISSFTAELGRSRISPAEILLIKSSGRLFISGSIVNLMKLTWCIMFI